MTCARQVGTLYHIGAAACVLNYKQRRYDIPHSLRCARPAPGGAFLFPVWNQPPGRAQA